MNSQVTENVYLIYDEGKNAFTYTNERPFVNETDCLIPIEGTKIYVRKSDYVRYAAKTFVEEYFKKHEQN